MLTKQRTHGLIKGKTTRILEYTRTEKYEIRKVIGVAINTHRVVELEQKILNIEQHKY